MSLKELPINMIYTRSCGNCQKFIDFNTNPVSYYNFCSNDCLKMFIEMILRGYDYQKLVILTILLKLSPKSTISDKAEAYTKLILSKIKEDIIIIKS